MEPVQNADQVSRGKTTGSQWRFGALLVIACLSVMGGQFWGLRQISALDGQQRAWNVGQVHRERELQELKDGFALRDVYRKCWAGLGTKEDAEQAVNLLVDYDWLMVCDVPTATRSARQYFVNPKCAICAVNDCPPTKPTKPTKPTDS